MHMYMCSMDVDEGGIQTMDKIDLLRNFFRRQELWRWREVRWKYGGSVLVAVK